MEKNQNSETLKVRSFFVIKEADLYVNKLNVIIGPQASGKSILVKLIYYFHSFFQDFLHAEDIETQNISIDEIVKILDQKFRKFFPSHSWGENGFSIIYERQNYKISIKRRKGSRNLKFELNQNFDFLIENFNKIKADILAQKTSRYFPAVFSESVRGFLKKQGIEWLYSSNIFIPASRSVLAHVQENIFTLLAENTSFDPFMAEFGRRFEQSRYLSDIKKDMKPSDKETFDHVQELEKIAQSIVAGNYLYEDKTHWIVMEHAKVKLVNASSGQQEALPMLMTLMMHPVLKKMSWPPYSGGSTFFIEEPEAHLFPEAQRKVLKIISSLFNGSNCGFLITTHSPYVMAALNNSIMASNVLIKKGVSHRLAVEKIIGKSMGINFKDVGAYTIEKGVLKDIKDNETQLINADVIDSVSNVFGEEFDALLDILGK